MATRPLAIVTGASSGTGCELAKRFAKHDFDLLIAAVKLGTDRPHVLRETILCCRKGGTVSVPGVYIGFLDKVPFGALMNKGLTVKTGQTHVHRYLQPLLNRIQSKSIRPS